MATYTGKPVTLPRPINQIYEKVADLSQYRDLVEQLPAEQREQLNGVEFDGETVRMDAPSIGHRVPHQRAHSSHPRRLRSRRLPRASFAQHQP